MTFCTLFPRTISMNIRIFLIISLLTACTPIPQSSWSDDGGGTVQLRLADYAYDSLAKTIQLYPSFGARENELLPSVIPLAQQNLLLAFDYLSANVERFYVKVLHCTADWQKSALLDLDYMSQYNEFNITAYEYSTDTHLPYIHYEFPVPAVKLSGNYVLMVYRDGNKEDLIFTKRFMVYQNRIAFQQEGNLLGPGRVADMNQQINFKINYNNIELLNPMQQVNVTIRQNQRWDNLVEKVKPSFVREHQRELEYRFFDPEKMFKGGNEFRFFDLRSIQYPGRNVGRVDRSQKPYTAWIQTDQSRAYQAYAQYNDINGMFGIDNQDYTDVSAANYLYVNFTLKCAEPIDGNVYVVGAFNYWNHEDENRMLYNANEGTYQAQVLLKQGWYDYQYVVASPILPPLYFEGSHFETENTYEIFVYYSAFQPRADLLIGYNRLQENER